MTKYAVNWAGIRYDYSGDDPAWANLKPGTILYLQSNGLGNASGNTIKEIGREKHIENSAKPPPLPTETELNFTSGLKVLFVGMRPTDAANHTKVVDTSKDGEEQKEGRKRKTNKGQSVQAQQDGLIVSHDPQATRVVVPFDKQNVNYYVLLTPNSAGICKGLSCDGDEVFFFEEFRDDVAATSFGRRKIATVKAIRAAANIQTKSAPKVIDTSIAQIIEEKSSNNEIAALITAYLSGGDRVLLEHCMRLLDLPNTDNGERNRHLVAFLCCDEAVGEETAEEVKADIEMTWPPLKALHITPTELVALSQGIASNGLAVHVRYGRAFLVAAVRQLRRDPEVFSEHVAEILDDCKLQIGPDDMVAGGGISLSEVAPLRDLLDALLQEVKGIRVTNAKQTGTLKNYVGAQVTSDALETVMAKLSMGTDGDAARLYLAQLFRLLVNHIGALGSDVDKRLEGFNKLLETLRDGIDEDLE